MKVSSTYSVLTYDHVRVAYRLDLVDLVLIDYLVELRVQFVKHLHHLQGREGCRQRRESYDITEED